MANADMVAGFAADSFSLHCKINGRATNFFYKPLSLLQNEHLLRSAKNNLCGVFLVKSSST